MQRGRKFKRLLSLGLVLLMLVTLMPMPAQGAVSSMSTYAATEQKLIIHYQRPAQDYDGWELWFWQEGGEGKAVTFSGQDDFGKYVAIDKLADMRYGFIVRKGNWEAKDIGKDRFIDLVALNENGITEVWLGQDQEAVLSKAPAGAKALGAAAFEATTASDTASVTGTNATNAPQAGDVNLIVHYRRFDSAYDGWNLWVWPKTKEGKGYTFTGQDDFGQVATIPLTGLDGIEEIGIIVRKGEWEQKDIDGDRFIPISKIDAKGNLHVYVVQGTETLYYNVADIDLSPKFIKAQFLDDKAVKLTTSMPIKKSDLRQAFALVGTSGHTLTPAGVSAAGDLASEFVITFKDSVHIGEAYSTRYGDYKALNLDLSGLYDTSIFEDKYNYDGPLGAAYTKDETTFRVWSPVAQAMTLKLYSKGDGGQADKEITMVAKDKGLWESTVMGDLAGLYYTYTISYAPNAQGTVISKETYDPYALAAGVNGDRSMVVDLDSLKPEGFGTSSLPQYEKANDLVVYEMHIRDLTQHESSGAVNKGKYLGVVEEGTTYEGVATGLDHLKEMGITHVQILPMYDYNSIDETRLDQNQFNWGYDPKNYSVPEGSYATDPYDGKVRVKELRQMVEGLHGAGIGVIMDVVYNHTALSADSNLEILAPGYYYRMVGGKFSNGSGTGNETASERFMVRRLMIDSLKHWVNTYHIDGFRFDLMGVHDIETMTLIEKELRAINPNIIIYGEGWTGGTAALPEALRLVKKNLFQVPGIGAFNDDFRDAIKGHVFEATAPGFVAGKEGFIESLKFGFVGAGQHPQIKYSQINYSKKAWTQNPSQSVNYVSAHDNLTLWDKLAVSAPDPDFSAQAREKMQRLANAMVLTSQGMPFMHAGVEMLRTKEGDHNSYKSSDQVNNINWQWKVDNATTVAYYQGLIELRKAFPQLRMATADQVAKGVDFFDSADTSFIKLPDNETLLGMRVVPVTDTPDASEATDATDASTLVLLFNGGSQDQKLTLPRGSYDVLVDHQFAGSKSIKTISGGELVLPATSAMVLKMKADSDSKTSREETDQGGLGLWALVALGALGLAGLGAWTLNYYKKTRS